MKVILVIMLLSACAFGQTDVCREVNGPSGGNTFTFKPDGTGSTAQIVDTIKLAAKSSFPNIIVRVPAGRYSGETEILINAALTGGKALCLKGENKPVIRRTKFDQSSDASIIKIDKVGDVVVRGFELEGAFVDEGESEVGVSVLNSGKDEISNIRVEDNFIHTVGRTYKNCQEKNSKGERITCGQAHGINVNSVGEGRISRVYVERNRLANLRLGESEALTINNNVADFVVSGNAIWDVDNIGIDIGGQQDGQFQATGGVVSGNKIIGLKFEPYRNASYPFVAGIYVDGGTGTGWTNPVRVENNVVTGFGIGISVGSENDYCDGGNADPADDRCKTKTAFVLIENNVLYGNQLYGVGVGKENDDQNSQTWECKVVGNTIYGNNLNSAETGYSELHFGTLEPNSLKSIEVRNNLIISTARTSALVRVTGLCLKPDVTFDDNTFFKNDAVNLWEWAGKSDYTKDDLFDPKTNRSTFSKHGIKGENNYWVVTKSPRTSNRLPKRSRRSHASKIFRRRAFPGTLHFR